MRAIDGDELSRRMYTEAFLKDTDMQKWDSGCWIRYKLFENVLEEQPTIEPEQRWIPCSERLPKIGKEVLLSEPNDMFIAEYYGSGLPEGVWRVDGIDHYLQDIKGCAWMPLPEPWKGGTQE